MPAFDAARYLRQAVESILGQSFGDFEFIVVDDGSSDDTLAMLRDYAAKDPRLRVFARDHEGLVAALNFGIGQARGVYLARMDTDDIAMPDRFEKQVAALDADPSLGVLGSFVEAIDEGGRPICRFEAPTAHEDLDRAHLQGGAPRIWHPAVMMRTEILRRAGGYSADYPYTEDYELWLRMAEISRLANLPEPLLRYRLHLGSVSVTKRDWQAEATARVLRDTRRRRGLPAAERKPGQARVPSELDVVRKWGWWALGAGNLGTARHYAVESLRRAPFSRRSLALLVSVLRARRAG